MKITKISCEQFAGVRDCDISLTDGMNLIYGKNESGKSTLVNLLSHTLFQDAKLDGRKDKEFCENCFPSEKKDSQVTADFVDGKVKLETQDGTYTLEKVWGEGSKCKLTTPDGSIANQKKIDGILKEVLIYGKGVYDDMLFSSQYNTDISLQTILDASKKADSKDEILSVLSQAFAESDGISLDAIEQAINKEIEDIEGKHWDYERELPKDRTSGERWTREAGEILEAYYAQKDKQDVLDKMTNLRKEADEALTAFDKAKIELRAAEEAYEKFDLYYVRLETRAQREELIERDKKELEDLKETLKEWPKLSASLRRANELQLEKSNRDLLDSYEKAKGITDKIASLRGKITGRDCPSEEKIDEAKEKIEKIRELENHLCGMNITTAIKMLGDNQITITSVRSDETIALSEGAATLTEAVKVCIPGVMEMQLSPADVDTYQVEKEIREHRKDINEIFETYQVDSSEALSRLRSEINQTDQEIKLAEGELKLLLGENRFEELETKANAIPAEIRGKDEINSDILALCGDYALTNFIADKKAEIKIYENKHTNIGSLENEIANLKKKIANATGSLPSKEDIPEEYCSICDPETYREKLRSELEGTEEKIGKRELRDKTLEKKSRAIEALENFMENASDDPEAERDEARRVFDEKKELLAHWKHIQKVFREKKDEIHDNPVQDIADSFAEYLSIISGGRVSSEFPESDKLNLNIYSDDNLLDYAKLSEGTKETVSLAFRLAVLDHLFPNGGGIIVFDDPFTDMDADRTAQACELIKECSKKHQVLFLTCNEEYKRVFDGNFIELSSHNE